MKIARDAFPTIAIGGWPGTPDASTQFPAVYAIDWIRAYRRNAAQ
jgi:hypothetical protein